MFIGICTSTFAANQWASEGHSQLGFDFAAQSFQINSSIYLFTCLFFCKEGGSFQLHGLRVVLTH